MKRFRSLFAALLGGLILLTACTDDSTPGSTPADTSAAVTTAAPEPTVTELVICDAGVTDFTIIRSETDTGNYINTAISLNKKLDALLGVDFGISTDWENRKAPTPADAHEIIIGETTRAESLAAKADLTAPGYLIRVTEHKIVVYASSLGFTTNALHALCDLLVDPVYSKDGRVALPIGLEIRHEGGDEPAVDLAAALQGGASVKGSIEEIFNYPPQDGFTAAQGADTDGTYAYIAMKKKNDDGNEVDRIVKVDMATWEVVKVSETLPLDHANDMTYDSTAKRLIVTHRLNGIISIIDPETLTITEIRTLPFTSYAVAYNVAANRFVFASGNKIVITDENFNMLNSPPPQLASAPGYTGQGMDADETYIYVPLSPSTTKDNIIQIYDWDGKYYGNVSIPTTQEIETIFHFGDQYYAQFNQKGATVYTLEIYVSFE